MKRINFILVLIALSVFSFELVSFIAYAHERRRESIVPDLIFTSESRQDVETTIVVRGNYMRSCSARSDFYEVKVDAEKQEVIVHDYALLPDGTACKNWSLNYMKEVNLGQLPPGLFKVYFAKDSGERFYKGEVRVEEISESVASLAR